MTNNVSQKHPSSDLPKSYNRWDVSELDCWWSSSWVRHFRDAWMCRASALCWERWKLTWHCLSGSQRNAPKEHHPGWNSTWAMLRFMDAAGLLFLTSITSRVLIMKIMSSVNVNFRDEKTQLWLKVLVHTFHFHNCLQTGPQLNQRFSPGCSTVSGKSPNNLILKRACSQGISTETYWCFCLAASVCPNSPL